jgi:hypothetical protein
MNDIENPNTIGLTVSGEVTFFSKPSDDPKADWREIDSGPGYVQLPADEDLGLRVKRMDNDDLKKLAEETTSLVHLIRIDLSENRKISNEGLDVLCLFKHLTDLNLSSCSITDTGLADIVKIDRLTRLNLAYCNRITDKGVRTLSRLRRLVYLDLQGVPKINNTSLSKIRRTGLTIHA